MNATGKPLAGRIALVTGASRGIGRAVAIELARQGAHVIAAARTSGGLEELDDEIKSLGGAATLAPFNLRQAESIEALAQSIAQRWGVLDVLVGNAAVLGTLTPVAQIDAKTWAEAFEVNVTANWRLICAFDALLRRSEAGRAVFVTSGAAQKTRAYWGNYSATKAALNALVQTYAAELEGTSVRVNLVSPGPVRTSMRAKAMPGEDPASLRPPEAIAPAIAAIVSPDEMRNGAIIDLSGHP